MSARDRLTLRPMLRLCRIYGIIARRYPDPRSREWAALQRRIILRKLAMGRRVRYRPTHIEHWLETQAWLTEQRRLRDADQARADSLAPEPGPSMAELAAALSRPRRVA